MIGPAWLAALFGIVMMLTATTALVRMIVAWRTRAATDYEIDGHHVLMGVSMAGMLIPGLFITAGGPATAIWLVVWVLITIWFTISVIRDATRRARGHGFTGHHLPHLVMSGAMIYMFAVMGTGTRGPGSAMYASSNMSGMSADGGLVPLPTLDYAFVIFMVGYAVLVIDRLPGLAVTGDTPVTGHAESAFVKPLAPITAILADVAMAITMGYMLTIMFI